jgi:hypothetical protein
MTCVLASGLIAGARAADALSWDRQAVDVTAEPNTTVVKHAFVFTNTGDQAVTIESVKTSCGCTTAKLEKKVYEPGESGTIEAEMTVDVEGNGEPIRKTIYVIAKGAERTNYALTYGVTVPRYLEVTNDVLAWDQDAPATAQVVTVKVVYEQPIRITQATADKAGFTTKLEEVEKGRLYRLTVTPKSTADKAVVQIALQTDFPAGNPMVHTVRGVVRAAPPKPGFWSRVWVGVLRLVP